MSGGDDYEHLMSRLDGQAPLPNLGLVVRRVHQHLHVGETPAVNSILHCIEVGLRVMKGVIASQQASFDIPCIIICQALKAIQHSLRQRLIQLQLENDPSFLAALLSSLYLTPMVR